MNLIKWWCVRDIMSNLFHTFSRGKCFRVSQIWVGLERLRRHHVETIRHELEANGFEQHQQLNQCYSHRKWEKWATINAQKMETINAININFDVRTEKLPFSMILLGSCSPKSISSKYHPDLMTTGWNLYKTRTNCMAKYLCMILWSGRYLAIMRNVICRPQMPVAIDITRNGTKNGNVS